ncbi:protein tincar [Cimex lectularius]|uniref:Protein tincar n=1 Tax=Cimex lectularius TaxID=79782 RepID=A0A8I6RZ25_CIMLE|nr:protein tincar [Cimex lectularius]
MPGVEHKEGARLHPPEEEAEDVKRTVCKVHVNTLSSIWYGLTFTALQAYLAINLSKKLLECLELPWENDELSLLEIKACLALTALAIVLLPFFLACSFIKIGNLANDGFKIGQTLSTCGLNPEDSLAKGPGGVMTLWRHGGPTAPFLHIVIAFSLLLPNLLIKARLIEGNFLQRDYVWKTDLDFLLASYDRLMVLSFVTAPSNKENELNISKPTPFTSFTTLSAMPEAMKFTSQQEPTYPEEEKWGSVTVEFFNYALALFVYAVRYPAVFWNTNKVWGTLFSFQLFINGIQNLVLYIGISVLYKVHLIGPSELLTALPTRFGSTFFLLNPYSTLVLYMLTLALILLSSLVLYLYGYGRFNAFLSHEKACKIISVEGKERGYLTHCAALCVLLGIAVVEGPLLVDLAVIYKATLDSSVLVCVVGAVFHLFIWVVLWLILTLKQNWQFKVRVTVGKATVRSARSIKLLTDVELLSSSSSSCEFSVPLLVVASGRTYTVCDSSPKKTIINAIHKAALERKNKLEAEANLNKDAYDENEEQIYWLRPKPISPKNSPDSEISDHGVSWQRNAVPKPKVTFDTTVKCAREFSHGEGDDGDYARLRELPMMGQNSKMRSEYHHSVSNQNEVQYVSTNKCMSLPAAGDYEDPNPLLTPEPPDLPLPPPQNVSDTPTTPRCLLRADSGMPHDLTPRTESETSGSPPDHSETSSGVHSNSSRESHHNGAPQPPNNINNIDKTAKVYAGTAQWQQTLQRANPVPDTNQVLIRHRMEPEIITVTNNFQDQFGRSTNMKMTSFTDSQSATLPHFPTQQVGVPYPHCSTMPLPPPTVQPMPHLTCNYPRHSTIPTHHNGVRLFTPNPYVKRPIVQRYPHHSFPHLNPMKHNINNISERDSANFSMASSGDSDTYHS